MKLRKLPSRIKRKLRELPVIEALANRISDRRFRAWQKLNPGGTFGDYYAAKTVALLEQGRGHYTLGGRGKVKDHGATVEWAADDFAARALDIWETVVGFGLTPSMKCVDYGCGSLRLGQHAMRYLEPGHYCGMDVVDTFINQGLALIDPTLIAAKAPRLLTITPETLSKTAAWRPEFIFSSAVLQHVPPDELPEYFRRLGSLMSGTCTAHIIYVGGPRLKRVKALNWVYPTDRILAALAAGAPQLAMVEDRTLPQLGTVEGRSRRVLTLRHR
ncbi:MAG: hypothetical protein ABIR63_06185 [Sphingomicrobium sp.]